MKDGTRRDHLRWVPFAAILLLTLAVLLAACDTAPPPPSTPTPAATPTAQAAATLDNGARLNTSVSGTVELWHFWASPVRRNAIRRVSALCTQMLPGVTVSDTIKAFGGIWTDEAAAVEAGEGVPDVVVEDRPKLSTRAKDGIVQNLQPWADRDGLKGSDYWPFTWSQTLYENQSYGIPYETDVRVLFYNKNAFEEAGLDPEKPPVTWDDLWAAADKLDRKNADGTYSRIAFLPVIGSATYEVWGYTNGADWTTPDGKPHIDTPEALETVKWVKKWYDRYGGWDAVQEFRKQFGAIPNDAFMTGKVAMFVDINGYASQLNFFRPRWQSSSGESANLEWGVADLPYGREKASWSGGFALSIPKGAKNPEAAWEFIKCATAPEAQASWARDTYAMPANIAAASDPILLADPSWKVFVDAMSYSRAGNTPIYVGWTNDLATESEKVWKGEISPEEALRNVQEKAEQEMNALK